MSTPRVYGKFYGVYLLFSLKHALRKKTYIGFTVDPANRLKEHNGGMELGGAKKTHNRGPWDMIVIVHGFPAEFTALQFEWAWQNPYISNRLKQYMRKRKHRENELDFNLEVLTCMLSIPPWNGLSLSIKWVSKCPLPTAFQAVLHKHQLSLSAYEKNYNLSSISRCGIESICVLCTNSRFDVPAEYWQCLNKNCNTSYHPACLASLFTQDKNILIPISGHCPECEIEMIWCDLVTLHE